MPILTSSGVPKILQNRILGNILACFKLTWKVLGLSWKPLGLPLEWRRGFTLFRLGCWKPVLKIIYNLKLYKMVGYFD